MFVHDYSHPCFHLIHTRVKVTCYMFGPHRSNITPEIKGIANLMQLGNFIDVFLARHVSGTYARHQEH